MFNKKKEDNGYSRFDIYIKIKVKKKNGEFPTKKSIKFTVKMKILINFCHNNMDVHFRTAFGMEMILTLNPTDTITAVKEMISEKTEISMADILLFYQSYNLRDDLTMEELDVKDDEFIGIRVHKRSIIKDLKSDDPNVMNLMNFGFTRQASLSALISSNGNFNQALEKLLNDGNGSDNNDDDNNKNDNVNNLNGNLIPEIGGDDPIERLVNFSGFDRSIVTQVYESFHKNEEETRVYLQQMISG